MDYRPKMVSNAQKYKNDDEDDEDLEALRLAALKSLKSKSTSSCSLKSSSVTSQSHLDLQANNTFSVYNNNLKNGRREYGNSSRTFRQNGNVYHFSRNNQNLIEIVPVEESTNDNEQSGSQASKPKSPVAPNTGGDSKFQRFRDNESTSEDEDQINQKSSPEETNKDEKSTEDVEANKENHSGDQESLARVTENAKVDEDDEDEEIEQDNDDDDDILLMADLEEEDSLERLMDEMEKEMKVDKVVVGEKKDKKLSKKENREIKKLHDTSKTRKFREVSENSPLENSHKHVRRSASPGEPNRVVKKRRSVSPPKMSKSRRKSPRRSPRRLSPRQNTRKFPREDFRLRSPRRQSPKYSPKPRMSKSPRSPVRSPIKPRKLSPRGRSHSRSPLNKRQSRSPRIVSRSRSPKNVKVRSPRLPRSKSPKNSPGRNSPSHRMSPRTRQLSPKLRSPTRRQLSPKTRSPRITPERKQSPPTFLRTTKSDSSPRRNSPSPYFSPHRSPWSSPRNSPRNSPLPPPKRRHSPEDNSAATYRNIRRSKTPEDSYKKETSPIRKHTSRSPDSARYKVKSVTSKELRAENEVSNDPILEARRRKFESTRPIDPVNDNKKIKLNTKSTASKKFEALDNMELDALEIKAQELLEEMSETELRLPSDNFDESNDPIEQVNSDSANSDVVMCVEVAPVKVKERVKKKKKKDKELYRIGKLKSGELPLSERIGKEKKFKKGVNSTSENSNDDTEAVVDEVLSEETDLRTELSRRRAERLNRSVPFQSARLLQSAFKGVVNEVVKNNAKITKRHLIKGDDKNVQKEIRRVTVLHRPVAELHDSEDETVDSKVPVRLRLGLSKSAQETRESKSTRKLSKRQGRKVKHKNLLATDH